MPSTIFNSSKKRRTKVSNTIEEKIISAYDDALSNYLHARWPFRHTEKYGVGAEVVGDEADIAVESYLDKDGHEYPISVADIKITTKTLHAVGIDGLIADGRVIVHAQNIAWPSDKAYRAIWLEQSRGYALKTISGFYIRGHFVATDDKAKAYRVAEEGELKVAA
jgi:hypothetical protein